MGIIYYKSYCRWKLLSSGISFITYHSHFVGVSDGQS